MVAWCTDSVERSSATTPYMRGSGGAPAAASGTIEWQPVGVVDGARHRAVGRREAEVEGRPHARVRVLRAKLQQGQGHADDDHVVFWRSSKNIRNENLDVFITAYLSKQILRAAICCMIHMLKTGNINSM